jgi:hypothetical protein
MGSNFAPNATMLCDTVPVAFLSISDLVHLDGSFLADFGWLFGVKGFVVSVFIQTTLFE